MIYFSSDYSEGCHPRILERLSETNLVQSPGYGMDEYCESAAARIKKACGRDDIDVHFMSGGTQTNMTVLASILRPHQGALCASSGHIAGHEAGAVEATGHKVLTLADTNGTICADQVIEAYEEHFNDPSAEHSVQPGLVYISFPTEKGTLYSKAHLEGLYAACKKCSLPLFIDGARLGYGLSSPQNDLTLADIARLCDIFYIGGTKCGTLIGEAVVITADKLKKDFRYAIKQRGGLLAKGRLLGIQFDELFKDNLYFDICESAVKYALEIKSAFEKAGVLMHIDSPTNQQFPVLTEAQAQELGRNYVFKIWGKDGDRLITRFCTSWATRKEQVDALIKDIGRL